MTTLLERPYSSVEMAVAVLVDRLQSLSSEDRNDLYELSRVLLTSDDEEERNSAHDAIVEILDQAPIRLHSLQLPTGPGMELRKWTEVVGRRIRDERKQSGITQEQLAERTGIDQGYISRLERGEHSPSHATLERIARAMAIEVTALDPTNE